MQGTQVWLLVWEDLICCWAASPMRHNSWSQARACEPQLLEPASSRVHALQPEKPPQWEARAPQLGSSLGSPQLEKGHAQQWRLSAAKNKQIKVFIFIFFKQTPTVKCQTQKEQK